MLQWPSRFLPSDDSWLIQLQHLFFFSLTTWQNFGLSHSFQFSVCIKLAWELPTLIHVSILTQQIPFQRVQSLCCWNYSQPLTKQVLSPMIMNWETVILTLLAFVSCSHSGKTQNQAAEEERSLLLLILEVLVHGWLAPLLWGCDGAEHPDGEDGACPRCSPDSCQNAQSKRRRWGDPVLPLRPCIQ